MKNKKKFKSKIKIVSIALIVIAIGLVLSWGKIIKFSIASDTLKTPEISSNFYNSTSTAISLKDIKNNKRKDVILFSSSWCGSCNKLIQDLSQLAHDYPQINMYVMDLENDRDSANELKVPITPTLVLLENGETKNYPEVTIDNLSTTIDDFNRIGIR